MTDSLDLSGTPFTIVEHDEKEKPPLRILESLSNAWGSLPPLAQGVLGSYVKREGAPGIRLASDRSRWKGRAGWAAFDPKERIFWIHYSPFAHVPHDSLLQAGIAHELAHALFFVLEERWHRRATVHGGPEWLVTAILEQWGYDPDRADEWRRYLDETNDLLPPRNEFLSDDEYNQIRELEHKEQEAHASRRHKFLADNRVYLDVASGKCTESLRTLAERHPEQLPEALRKMLVETASAQTLEI
jgi:hypothetical protein